MHPAATQTQASETCIPVRLKSPNRIQAVQRQEPTAPRLVPLKKEFKAKVDLLTHELIEAATSAVFEPGVYAVKLEDSLAFGRKAADRTSRLVRRFVAKTFDGLETSPAYASVGTLREQFSNLNPNNPDELLESDKVFGLIPLGNKLNSYFKSYEAAIPGIKTGLSELKAARLTLENEAAALTAAQDEIWATMAKLEAAVYYTATLGRAVDEQANSLLTDKPEQALCLEVAAGHIRDAFDAWSSQQLNNVNTYLSMEALKKAYRELIAGLKQIESSSMTALASAQTVAGASGLQLKAISTLTKPMYLQDAAVQTQAAYAAKLEGFASDPRSGLAYIRAAISTALHAMRELDAFRFQAIGVIKHNNKLLQAFIAPAGPQTQATGLCSTSRAEPLSLAA